MSKKTCSPHPGEDVDKQLVLAVCLTGGFFVAEVVGGILADSLALLSDAGHMFFDVFSLGLTLFAFLLARRPPSGKRTYGWHRAEILVALFNACTLLIVAFVIFYHAFKRFFNPPAVRWAIMLPVGIAGLLVNLFVALRLHEFKAHSLNVRSAFLHVMSDFFGSLAVITAAGLISITGMFWIDPVLAGLIPCLILYGSAGLISESLHILLEGVPKGLKVSDVAESIKSVPGVQEVHHLHIWGLCSRVVALSCHIITDGAVPSDKLIHRINETLLDKFGISDTTVQIDIRPDRQEKLLEPIEHPEHDHPPLRKEM